MIVESIRLKAGRSPGLPSQEVQTGAITVFVGPNNSGKSRALSEIAQYATQPSASHGHMVLEELRFNGLTDEKSAQHEIDNMKADPPVGLGLQPGYSYVKSMRGVLQINPTDLKNAMVTPSLNLDLFSVWLAWHVLVLGGANRINLINQQPAGDFQLQGTTSFQRIFRDNVRRKEFRTIVYNALEPIHKV